MTMIRVLNGLYYGEVNAWLAATSNGLFWF